MDIAKKIADLRISRDLSQEELASRLFVSRDLVSKWETGTRRPDWQTIEELARIFDVSPSDIADKNELIFKELEKCLPGGSKLTVDGLVKILNLFLDGLSETEADIFIKRYYFFESTAEIAASFGLKENHVRSTLSRTRKKLKKFIKENENE